MSLSNSIQFLSGNPLLNSLQFHFRNHVDNTFDVIPMPLPNLLLNDFRIHFDVTFEITLSAYARVHPFCVGVFPMRTIICIHTVFKQYADFAKYFASHLVDTRRLEAFFHCIWFAPCWNNWFWHVFKSQEIQHTWTFMCSKQWREKRKSKLFNIQYA